MDRFQFTLIATVCILLTGCSSTGHVASWNGDRGDAPKTSTSGWGAPRAETAPESSPAPRTESTTEPANTCYVKTPHIPGPPENRQILKRPERTVAGTDVVIPAEYTEVQVFDENAEGFAWLPAVCEEAVDRHLIMRIQQGLIERGYDIGTVDGVKGPSTSAGLEYYKRDNGIYGEGVTHQLLKSLGIDPATNGPGFASL